MKDNLDINTPNGRIAAGQQLRATQIVFGKDPKFSFMHTPTSGAAAVDGFICKDGIITGVAEIKSRDMTYKKLVAGFRAEWILTHQKLLDLQAVARLLKIPAYGLLYLVPSDCVIVVVLVDTNGAIICKHREERTETQATCNGGTVSRLNSYIDVRASKVYGKAPEL